MIILSSECGELFVLTSILDAIRPTDCLTRKHSLAVQSSSEVTCKEILRCIYRSIKASMHVWFLFQSNFLLGKLVSTLLFCNLDHRNFRIFKNYKISLKHEIFGVFTNMCRWLFQNPSEECSEDIGARGDNRIQSRGKSRFRWFVYLAQSRQYKCILLWCVVCLCSASLKDRTFSICARRSGISIIIIHDSPDLKIHYYESLSVFAMCHVRIVICISFVIRVLSWANEKKKTCLQFVRSTNTHSTQQICVINNNNNKWNGKQWAVSRLILKWMKTKKN